MYMCAYDMYIYRCAYDILCIYIYIDTQYNDAMLVRISYIVLPVSEGKSGPSSPLEELSRSG